MKNRWDNVTQDELDEMVIDAKSGEAASINNEGREFQVAFLNGHLDEFPHLSREQKQKIYDVALDELDANCSSDVGFRYGIIKTYLSMHSIYGQLEIIPGDKKSVIAVLGFDPWAGAKNE